MPETAYILILRAISESEEIEIATRQGKDEVVVYSVDDLDHQLSFELIPSNIAADSSNELLQHVISICHRTKYGGKTLNEALSVEGLFPQYVARSKVFRGCLKPAFEIAAINWLMEKSGEAPIKVYSGHKRVKEVRFAERVTIVSFSLIHTKKSGLKQAFKYAIIFALRSLFGFIQSFRAQKNQYVLSYTPPSDIPVFALNGEMQMGDPVFGYLVDRIQSEDEFSILLVLKNFASTEKYSVRESFFKELKTRKGLFYEYYMVRALFNGETRKNWKLYLKHCSTVFKECIQKAEGLDRIILMSLASQVDQFGLMYLRFKASQIYMKEKRPLVIGAGNEHSYTKYPIICAAKADAVPTYGIQHGGISAQNVFYSFVEEDRAIAPIPDFTFTWGSYVHDRLVTNSIYSDQSLIITGQIRADVIPVLNANNRGTGQATKTLLYASQALPHLPQVRRRLFEDIFKLQKQNPGLNVIVKPHPREYQDIDVINEIAEEQGVVANIRRDDLYFMLSQSDVVVTYYSTAGAEAIYFDKELIVFDYDRTDIAKYHELGVGHMCSDYDELETTVHSIEKGIQKDLSLEREAFRQVRVFKIDGNSLDRTINAMRDISKK
jgi:hypothetical protein